MTIAKEEERFLNPYNFVRLLGSEAKPGLMGRCPPPPHDRWVPGARTGRIRVELNAVTPVFVSDSEGVQEREAESGKRHRSYRFYRERFGEREELALPASSLRGMVRSVFEAVTNSCLANFAYGSRLTTRLPPEKALELVPVRAVLEDEDGQKQWYLELLTGTADVANWHERPKFFYAASVPLYDPISGRAIRWSEGVDPRSDHRRECWALLSPFPPSWRVVAVGSESEMRARKAAELERAREQSASGPPGKGRPPRFICRRGFLCINYQNIEKKHSERFFFRDGSSPGPARIELPEPVRVRYSELIADYHRRHEKLAKPFRKTRRAYALEVGGKKTTVPSRFIQSEASRELRHGDVLYARLSGSLDSPDVKYLAPVSVPRLFFRTFVRDHLPAKHHKCDSFERLCPACRTFGWVFGRPGMPDSPADDETGVAYRSRVVFHAGRLDHDAGQIERATLQVLSAPKPTMGRFYLLEADRPPSDSLQSVGWDDPNMLVRGRKFYRHQPRPEEYESTEQSDQNRTVRDVLRKDSRFVFEVEFENLADAELGGLLWSLDFGGEPLHHRLGYGKPLGFGSLKAEKTRLELLDTERHCRQLVAEEEWTAADTGPFVEEFKKALADAYGAKDFSELKNVRDLFALLGEPPLPKVHYPRLLEEGTEGFSWFKENEDRKRGKRVALRLADEDDGLPYQPSRPKKGRKGSWKKRGGRRRGRRW